MTAAVNISSGGVLSVLGSTLGSIADLIDASAEALRLTAASEEGSLVGIQPLLESLAAGDHLPDVVIPIGFDIPNPFLPFVLPSIHVELARVSDPGAGAVVDRPDDHLREHRHRRRSSRRSTPLRRACA